MKGIIASEAQSKAFKELEKAEMIEKVKQGGLFGGACRYKFIGAYKETYFKGEEERREKKRRLC